MQNKLELALLSMSVATREKEPCILGLLSMLGKEQAWAIWASFCWVWSWQLGLLLN